ncbi:hypothetical protein J6590_011403 [Homalodisca vitripennis]|nr:hypothetical protein J6590_011403 [Homalodisca vitripennis]
MSTRYVISGPCGRKIEVDQAGEREKVVLQCRQLVQSSQVKLEQLDRDPAEVLTIQAIVPTGGRNPTLSSFAINYRFTPSGATIHIPGTYRT